MEKKKKRNVVRITIKDQTDLDLITYIYQHLKKYSMKQISSWFDKSAIRVNGKILSPKVNLRLGDVIIIVFPEESVNDPVPQNIPLNILYEDKDIIVINKPAGLSVHPAPGTPDGTLVNGLLNYTSELSNLNGSLEPGIVHRLDKDTSGLMVIAKNNAAHKVLSDAIAARLVKRIYAALVWGVMDVPERIISAPVGTSHVQGQRYAVSHTRGKPAKTHYLLLESYEPFFSLLQLSLMTGRSHQIRLHMEHIDHPVVGDPDYCKLSPSIKLQPIKNTCPELFNAVCDLKRQLLHATVLIFKHPKTGKQMTFETPPPEDYLNIISLLSKYKDKFIK